MAYETIFSPVQLGSVTLKNRIIFAPTTLGLPTEQYLEKIRRISAGGCAMVIIGDVPVTRRAPMSLYHKKGFSHYQKLCEIVHANGGRICAQLYQSDSNIKAMMKYIPGVLTKKISMTDLRTLLNEQVEPLITKMTTDKIHTIIDSFGNASVLAKKAGFDMIQVHGDRMCGSFSSSLYNKRKDEYGGIPENRARFAAEAVAAVRSSVPDIPIDFKLPVRQENPHYGNAGVLFEELAVFIPILEKAGVTSFHVALANHGELSDTIPPKNHPYFSEEGCFLKYCDEIRNFTKLPLCGVGGLGNPDFIEQQLSDGRIDCAAMSRQLIADPAWANKVLHGQVSDIYRCIRCNKDCLGGLMKHKGVHCIYDKAKD